MAINPKHKTEEQRLAYNAYIRAWRKRRASSTWVKKAEQSPEQRRVARRAAHMKWRTAHLEEFHAGDRERHQQQRDTASLEWTRKQSRSAVGRVYQRRYGLTLEQYEAKLTSQNNLCGLCGLPFDITFRALSPALDHNHGTKKLRDFIHWRCNLGLGNFRDDLELCRKAVSYLEKHHES